MMPLRKRRLRPAGAAIFGGIAVLLGLELLEEPGLSAGRLLFELVDILPTVFMSAGVVLLFQIVSRQRDRQTELLRDVEMARLEGEQWRADARALLDGLGEAIEKQFSRWNLTEAEREVALLLLKGLSLKEAANVRATTERTIRAHARAIYTKAGLTGRAALSAFFLEDLLAPIAGTARDHS